MREQLIKSKKIVVKAGTSILTSKTGRFSQARLAGLGRQIAGLLAQNKEMVLVSSGSIAMGMQVLGFQRRPQKMDQLQACAAVGQGKLMHAYEKFFSSRGIHAGQLLLTRDGLEDRSRFLRARATLRQLVKMKLLPIINENDTVSTEEIAFGDNDGLSVHVAQLVGADLLVLLSDVDGFFLRDGSRIRQVSSLEEIQNVLTPHLRDSKKERTVGGMKAKLEAAKKCMKLGIPMVIVNGHTKNVIQSLLDGQDVGTLFLPGARQGGERKKWIAFSAARSGSIVVDQGAYEALSRKKCSLLPGGLIKSKGSFKAGEVVEIENQDGLVFGRGVVKYSHDELSSLAGRKTSEIKDILGYKSCDEVINRNDLVIWD